MLQLLQRRYEEIVFKRSPRRTKAAGGGDKGERSERNEKTDDQRLFTDELEALWTTEIRNAERAIDNSSLGSLSEKLDQGALLWLQWVAADGFSPDGWNVQEAEIVSFGNDLHYGKCLRWIYERMARHIGRGWRFCWDMASGCRETWRQS